MVASRQDPLPTRRLLLPIRLESIRLLRVPTAIRLRRLIRSRLLRVVPKRHPVTASVRALNTLVPRAGLAQAHDRAPAAAFVALGLCVPEAVLAVAAVVRVVAA